MLDYRTHTFLEAYRQRSFTQAAEALHITQPAVSQHIRQLETHYGCTLFAKSGRGIEPTAAGEELYRALSTMENDERRLTRTLKEEPGKASPLAFGATLTIGEYVMPRYLIAHQRSHPKARLSMSVANTRELLSRIDEGSLDFALVEGYFDASRYDCLRFSTEKYVAVCGANSPLACTSRPERVEDLFCQRLILREPGSGTREILEKHLAAQNRSIDDFTERIELGSIRAIKASVEADLGISFLYRVAVERELDEGRLVDITPQRFAIEHDFSLVWQKGSMFADRYRSLFRMWTGEDTSRF